jgi:hypothetical protein
MTEAIKPSQALDNAIKAEPSAVLIAFAGKDGQLTVTYACNSAAELVYLKEVLNIYVWKALNAGFTTEKKDA